MAKVLVTGCAGFIGRHLVKQLVRNGNDVWGIDDLSNSVSEGQALPAENFMKMDINKIKYPAKRQVFDVVYHLAALHSVPDSFDRPVEYYHTNIIGTHNICNAFPDARIVNISSSSAKECLSPYGISKLGAEKVTGLHKNSVTLRLYNVFGEGQPDIGCIMPRFIKQLLKGEQPTIFGDGKQSRDFTYVKDVVDVLIAYGQGYQAELHSVHDVGYGNSITVQEVYDKLCSLVLSDEYTGRYIIPKHVEARIGDIRFSRANARMDYKKYGFDKGLKGTVKWFKENEK